MRRDLYDFEWSMGEKEEGRKKSAERQECACVGWLAAILFYLFVRCVWFHSFYVPNPTKLFVRTLSHIYLTVREFVICGSGGGWWCFYNWIGRVEWGCWSCVCAGSKMAKYFCFSNIYIFMRNFICFFFAIKILEWKFSKNFYK